MTEPTIWELQKAGKSKADLIRAFASLTPAKIIKGNYPTIGQLIRDEGKTARVEKGLAVLVTDFNTSVGGVLKTFEIEELALEITSDHLLRSMSLEYIYYALRDLKITNSHGAITLNKTLKALRNHNSNRMELVRQQNENRHLSNHHVAARSSDLMKAKENLISIKTSHIKITKAWESLNNK